MIFFPKDYFSIILTGKYNPTKHDTNSLNQSGQIALIENNIQCSKNTFRKCPDHNNNIFIRLLMANIPHKNAYPHIYSV